MDTNKKIQRFDPSFETGLTECEVFERREHRLVNVVPNKITKTNGQIIRDNVCTLFNAYNLAIAVCLALVGAYSNIFFIVIVSANVLIGIIQEIKAKKLVENLSIIGATKSTVVRSGKEQKVLVDELVLDDVSVLWTGSQICADSIVLHGEVEVNEALLTGETDPVLKKPGDMLLSGSFVVSGKCYARVDRIGEDNFAAMLALKAKKHKRINSELLGSMRKVTKFTSYFIIPIGVILFLEALILRRDSVQNSVVSTAAALLGMLPKGLVLLISVSLVIGIIKLSKKKILVQDLYAIETLAHIDTLCLDKTGTLTEGKMSVSNFYIIEETLPISAEQAICCFVGALDDNNSTFTALKEYFPAHSTHNLIRMIPFSSERKWSAVTLENIGTIILGAPEKILSHGSAAILPSEAVEAQKSGKRILCLGFTPEQTINEVLSGITLIAVIELSDSVRKDAKDTLDFFQREGVEIKIISGDNPITVSGVAKQVGLENYDSYIDFSEMCSEEEITRAVKQYTIFGRVSPEQKGKIIKALQSAGRKVAMTGDGVNDVLALKEADCSIAMAAGSDAAKQVSQIVLVESDFSALPEMVMEGRRVVNNITRFGGVFFIKTLYSVLVSILSCVTLTSFPFLPIQITLYDVIVESYPALLLLNEPDHNQINGKFLNNVILRALPFSVLITINIAAVMAVSPLVGISATESVNVMYYLTSFAGLLGVIKSCCPFTKVRVAVCVTAVVGFYIFAYMFSDMLHLKTLSISALRLSVSLIALYIPLIWIFIKASSKIKKLYSINFYKN